VLVYHYIFVSGVVDLVTFNVHPVLCSQQGEFLPNLKLACQSITEL